MSAKVNGGPAFPQGNMSPVLGEGMTLRDYFAGQALVAILGTSATIKIDGKPITGESEFAAAAYEFADAMIKQRTL